MKTKGQIVAINKYWDDIACEWHSQVTIDFTQIEKKLHLGEIEVEQK